MAKKTFEVSEPHERRSQEERSSATQLQILRAATEILYAEGFAAATTQRIAAQAGVSRGAMLHHFPSKVDLMVAVFQLAHDADTAYLREHLEKIELPFDRVASLPQLTWKALSGPSGIAALEIMMASRSDHDLAQKLEPVQTQIEAESQQRVAELMHSAGLTVDDASRELVTLVVAAIRGLSIQAMFRKESRGAPSALRVLQSLVETQLLKGIEDRATETNSKRRVPTPPSESNRPVAPHPRKRTSSPSSGAL